MKMHQLIQITDCHLMADSDVSFRKQPVYSNLHKVIEKASQHPADALLLTGDLAEQMQVETYQHYVTLLKNWCSPIYFIPGNHDDPELMAQVFANHFCTDKTFSLGNWQIVLLNSKLPYDSGEGIVNQSQIDFLTEVLAKHTDKFFVVVLHHHVLATNGHMDKYGLQNQQEFLTLLAQYKNIKVVLSGHIHQAFDETYHGIRFLATPATSYQMKPKREKNTIDNLDPSYRIIDLFDDGSFTTKVQRV